jgi:hypothetical protein
MQTWEYAVVVDTWNLHQQVVQGERQQAVNVLNHYGGAGWELVTVEKLTDLHPAAVPPAAVFVYFFRRAKNG